MAAYYVLVADVRRSKKYSAEARSRLQKLLSSSLKYLNNLYSYGIEKRVVFSGGDEIQGLFRDPLTPFLYYRMLTFIVGVKTLRGGIGRGDWSVRVEDETSPSQDGSAYHNARRALDEAKSNKPYDVVFFGNGHLDEYITVLIDHSIGMSVMRTSTQNDTALAIDMMFPLVNTTVAELSCFGKESVQLDSADLLCLRESITDKNRAKPSIMKGMSQAASSAGALPLYPVSIEEAIGSQYGPNFLNGKDIQGISHMLSALSGMTRQGVDRQLASSRVIQERNAVVALAYDLKRLWIGGE